MREKKDEPEQKLFRKISNNIPFFPTNLLLTPGMTEGLGIKMVIAHRAELQSDDATGIITGMLKRPMGLQQPHRDRFQSGPLPIPEVNPSRSKAY